MRSSNDPGISPFCGSSSLATGSTSSIANRRACSCSFSRSGGCHGGSSTGGSGCQVSVSLDVIVGYLHSAQADDHVHLGGCRFPPHAVVTREVSGLTPPTGYPPTSSLSASRLPSESRSQTDLTGP